MFGQGNQNAQKPIGGLFGSTGTTGTGLFGTSSTTAAPATGGLFGTQNTATSAGSLFGKPAAPATGFSLTGQPANTGAAPAAAPGGLFSTPATSKPSLFGQPATAANPTSTGGILGSAGAGLQFGQPKPTGTATPVLSGLLGAPAASTTAAPTATVLPTLGGNPSTAASTQPNTLGVGGLFGTANSATAGSGILGKGIGAAAPATLPSQPASAATTNFSFGIPKSGAATTAAAVGGGLSFNIGGSAATSSAAATTASSTGLGGLFTGVAAPTASSSAAGGIGSGLGLGLKTATTVTTSAPVVSVQSSLPTVSLGGSAAATAQQQAGKEVTFKQLEENVSKWNDDLDELERQFLAQATQINAWDRLVLENGDRITALNEEIGKIKSNQDKLDHELDFIGTQQQDLEEFINNLEGSLANSAISQPQDAADEQRKDIFSTAENVDCQLKQMTQDLREVIERINASSQNDESSAASPFGQLERILNAHVDSLNWADQNIESLSKQIDQIQIPKASN